MNVEVNIPLLRKAVEWAEAEAAKVDGGLWDQTAYAAETACGTTHCVAGWTVYEHLGHPVDSVCCGGSTTDGHPVADVARNALGLTVDQAGRLFAGSNTIAAVRRVAEDIAGERL